MKQRGFTLIELMIAIVFVLTIIMIALPVIMGNTGNVSWGINGRAETRCLEGYKFVIGEHGQPRQILDELGKGVRCYNNPEPGKPGSFGQ